MIDYDKQAQDFCDKYGLKIEWRFLHHEDAPEIKRKYRDTPTAWRNIWMFTLSGNGRSYSATYRGSVRDACGNEVVNRTPHKFGPTWERSRSTPRETPTTYDLLACLTKSNPGSFEDFCYDFGYDTDSRQGLGYYVALQAEWAGVQRVIPTEAMAEFQEIN